MYYNLGLSLTAALAFSLFVIITKSGQNKIGPVTFTQNQTQQFMDILEEAKRYTFGALTQINS